MEPQLNQAENQLGTPPALSPQVNVTGDDDAYAHVYQFADLAAYSFKQRLIIRLAGLVLYWLIRTIGATLRFEVRGFEHHRANEPMIYAFWHNRIPLATYFWRHRGIIVMSSQSFDSEYIARFIQRFGYGAIKGSSTRGGRGALINMIRAMRAGKSCALSVDGPRGPVYEAKPGAIMLAAKTGAAILPFSISLERCWRLRSWDRLEIPKPFSRAIVVIGAPLHVAADAGNDETERERLQAVLEKLRVESDQLV